MKYDVETREKLVKDAPAEKAAVPVETGGGRDERCERRLRFVEGVLNGAPHAVIVLDRQGNVAYANPAAARMLGPRPGGEARNLLDWGRCDVLDMEGRPLPREEWPLTKAQRGETLTDREILLRNRATGREVSGVYDVAPLKGIEGRDYSVVTAREMAGKAAGVVLLPALLELLMASVPAAVMATGCDIALFDERDRTFWSVAYGGRAGLPGRAHCATAEDEKVFAQRVMESRKPLVITDTKKGRMCSADRSLVERLGIRSMVVLPLEAEGRFLGAMTIDSTLDEKQLDERSMEALSALAKLAAVMIARAEGRGGRAEGRAAAAAAK